ncbi:putative membrane protein [Acinetobacter sp. 230853]|nr:putative membrane protein [Acinetobacter sp. 230853]
MLNIHLQTAGWLCASACLIPALLNLVIIRFAISVPTLR